jgi:hypothetical protein
MQRNCNTACMGVQQVDLTDLGALFRSLWNNYGNGKNRRNYSKLCFAYKHNSAYQRETTAISALCSGDWFYFNMRSSHIHRLISWSVVHNCLNCRWLGSAETVHRSPPLFFLNLQHCQTRHSLLTDPVQTNNQIQEYRLLGCRVV